MNKIKLAGIILISIFLGAGIILAGFWFLSGKLFSTWTNKLISVNQQNNAQSANCIFPTSADMALLDKHEIVKQTSLQCAAFEEAKLQYKFDPSTALTWDNAFPSRENWARRLRVFKSALENNWSVYHNEQYNFEFEYPQDWNVLISIDGSKIVLTNPGTQLVNPMVISIKYGIGSSNSSINEEIQGRAAGMVITRVGLVGNGGKIQESARRPDKYGKLVTLNNDYSTFEYHNFYRHGEFFIDGNLITVVQPLSIEAPDVAGWGKEQKDLLSKISSGSVNELVATEIKFIDRIVASFRPITQESVKILDNSSPLKYSSAAMDVDKWKTYEVSEYGFSFKYPSEWQEPIYDTSTIHPKGATVSMAGYINDNEYTGYSFSIQNYANASTSGGLSADFEGASFRSMLKKEMDEYRLVIKSSPQAKKYNGIFVIKNDAAYASYYSGFFSVADFFINKDHVQLVKFLPTIGFDCSTIQNSSANCYFLADEKGGPGPNVSNIQAKADEINKGTAPVKVVESIELFNKVLSTIQKL